MSQHHGGPPHHHQILMDPSHLSGLAATPRHLGHPGASHYGAPGPSHGLSLYPSMTPTQPHSAGTKRSRPDDLDLSVSGLPDLDQSDLESMQQTPMGGAYATASGAAPTHHHHRLPDQGPPSKMMRRDGGDAGMSSNVGGAPSVVGQVGMPSPAPRPRGPKLKFTPEDDQLLIDLKENKNLTWKQIADFFPGRSSGTLQVRYCTKLKAKTTQWTDETVSLWKSLSRLIADEPADRIAGSPFANGAGRLREREVAHHRQQSGHRLHSHRVQGTGRAADGRRRRRRRGRSRALIAISVSAGRFGARVRGHHLPTAASNCHRASSASPKPRT